MPKRFQYLYLAAKATTGNKTGAAIEALDASWDTAILDFIVEAVGATPTVTFKFQGSNDGTNWFDVWYVTDSSDTPSKATITVTGTGATVLFSTRPWRFFRYVTTSNTNVTFHAGLTLAGAA